MDVTAASFREGMSCLGAAVSLITSGGPEGRHGMTASAVCSITDSPPTLLVCVNQKNRSHDVFNGNGNLCVNVLAGRHVALADAFAGRGDTGRFEAGSWTTLQTGAPVLADAVVAFDCRIMERRAIGSHSVFYARVVALLKSAQAAETLIWFERRYHPLKATLPEQSGPA
ncbi:flavin reductase [Chelatococcus asaccharovorans]|uniref:Flavin reductase n=1 Tax=Chelatococcus asaccharovorans TaxID=28210 RepID=A0A2V3UIS9_9HYPH|nr:flavin reductase [Chelatococcus asaccharovorans]MBS7706670.1 flavin reductase [Chelatococcus asaccharovorans]PXW64680.1 flavin reductase [Chelatococcus asaccharovorans]CAH1663901.1 FMN reductase (NADH) RutF 1 [Chelatococcus asaccharovorans]CAH1682603.1 FMN reductase (NADH) RutF 1 [Chelatococcus asaccharovorans]